MAKHRAAMEQEKASLELLRSQLESRNINKEVGTWNADASSNQVPPYFPFPPYYPYAYPQPWEYPPAAYPGGSLPNYGPAGSIPLGAMQANTEPRGNIPSGAIFGPNIDQPLQITGPYIGQQPTQPGISSTGTPNPPVNNLIGVTTNPSIQHKNAQTTFVGTHNQGAQHLQLTPRAEATQSSALPETQQHQAGPDVVHNQQTEGASWQQLPFQYPKPTPQQGAKQGPAPESQVYIPANPGPSNEIDLKFQLLKMQWQHFNFNLLRSKMTVLQKP